MTRQRGNQHPGPSNVVNECKLRAEWRHVLAESQKADTGETTAFTATELLPPGSAYCEICKSDSEAHFLTNPSASLGGILG